MLEEYLYVDEKTERVRKIRVICGLTVSDEAYRPNGRDVFVNSENFLEEGIYLISKEERLVNLMTNGRLYKKTSDFESNGNKVIFHPVEKEFAEVKPGFSYCKFDKVKPLIP